MKRKPDNHWGRGVLQPNCAHVRETRDGVPVVHDVEGQRVGFAICGTWLIADAPDPDTTPEIRACSYCVALLDERADPQS